MTKYYFFPEILHRDDWFKVTDVSAGKNASDFKGQTVQGQCVRKYSTEEKN